MANLYFAGGIYTFLFALHSMGGECVYECSKAGSELFHNHHGSFDHRKVAGVVFDDMGVAETVHRRRIR
jgi:hypothetical protein